MRFLTTVLLTASATLAAATATVTIKPDGREQETPSGTLPPCAQISVLLTDYDKNQPPPTSVPANIAFECLYSIPLNVTSAKTILFEMPTYLNWQSTLDVLKNPPAEYVEKVQGPVDILGGLEVISAAVDAGAITSEYDFGWQLYKLLGAAHDGHLAYILDVLGRVFSFYRPLPLVSVSEDGSKLPAVFAYYDILGQQFANISYTPSPIVKINDRDVSAYLEEFSQEGGLQDRDALYNNLFYNLAQISLGSSGSGPGMFAGGGRARYTPLETTTTLEFGNGTTSTIENYARTYFNFSGVETGEDLRKKIIYNEDLAGANSRPSTLPKESDPGVSPLAIDATPLGYPVPVVSGPTNQLNGYYIDAPGFEEVAVLVVSSFVTSASLEIPFQAAGKRFLDKAWSEGKTKLVIDVQANGGGTILQAHDLYRKVFPNSDPFAGNRFRYNEAFDLVGQTFSEVASQYPRDEGLTNYTLREIQSSYFDYHTDMTVDGKPFESWKQKGGPYEVNEHLYSAVARWNLSDIYIPYQGGINVSGATNETRWKPENVVLVTDGYCASTCSIFAEMLTNEFGAKTLALGGRSHANRIQAIGGVKGANIYQWNFVRAYASESIDLNATLQTSALDAYNSSFALGRSWSNGLNVRDAVRKDDPSGIALQFKYEEADCRLYYTPEMTVNALAIWKAAAQATWSDTSKCIGNGGYSSGSYNKRASQDQTTTLSPSNSQINGIEAMRQLRAFMSTFEIETTLQDQPGGFMQP